MKKAIIFTLAAISCGLTAPQVFAQRFALKAYDDVTLKNFMTVSTTLPELQSRAGSNSFGLDFGYTFWRRNGNSLEANIGIGYNIASASFDMAEMSFDYAAPASADEDGNPYRRFTRLSDVKQKINFGYLNIPVFLQYEYRFVKWMGVYANVGVNFGFKTANSFGSVSGTADTYGVFPEYDDLVIKADYLNDFGLRYLDGAEKGKADVNGFSAALKCGAGLEIYVAEPVSFEVGVSYNQAFTNVFKGHYDLSSPDAINAETAPVTYSVAGGQQVKALSDYVTKSRLNPLSLHLGVNIRF